jgi:16S rRNA (uracil1498-N3)-methyltransferase
MKQFILPSEHDQGDTVDLTGDDFHYLVHVRRHRTGDVISARTPGGRAFDLRIDDIGRDRLRGTLLPAAVAGAGTTAADAAESAPREWPRIPPITLYQGLPKGRKLDTVVRQATEAGVQAIVPVRTGHSVVEWEGARGAKKLERLERIAREAAQQSGSGAPPRVAEIIDLNDIEPVSPEAGELGLVFHEKPLAAQALHEYLRTAPDHLYLAVGPEGGFSGDEITKLTDAKNFSVARLGETVLRTETAALYAIAAVQTILRERDQWA